MKCGFASPYINFLPPERCAKCGFSVKAVIAPVQPVKRFEIPVPDLDINTVANLGKNRDTDYRANPFAINDDDLADGFIEDDGDLPVSSSPVTPQIAPKKAKRLSPPPIIIEETKKTSTPKSRKKVKVSETIEVVKKPKKARKGRKTSDDAINAILAEGKNSPKQNNE